MLCISIWRTEAAEQRRFEAAEAAVIMQNENGYRKTAVVTGGSRGIGRAICLAFAGRGISVVIGFAGRRDAAEETARLCREAASHAADAPRFITCQADVSTEDGAGLLMDTAKKEFGRVDILVNCAGITRDGLLMMLRPEDFDAVIDTNLRGTFLTCRAVSRMMLKQRSGRIINISSVVGVHGNAGQTDYAASKAGVIGFTKSLAKEIASRGIMVNAVAPGIIATDMTAAMTDKAKEEAAASIPLKRIGSPEDVAAAVVFLASEEASYITGQVLCVDGGMGM